ncbi:MAG: electron transfer flavoprotein subunit alpha/FixB family protein [Oscillospiraceae bacterium]|nr:electron transfer flavoprotein subunit alpha/FixB family protein [Oscillospiraceae bacterium]
MSSICVYAEQFNGVVEPCTGELVTAARAIAAQTGQSITLLVLGPDTQALAKQLAFPEVQVAAVQTDLSAFQDDALSAIVAQALEQLSPASVLIPANRIARSLFSRVAVHLDAGLTADCSELFLGEDGAFLQKKSAFGANAMVVTAETSEPKLVTIQMGVYEPCPLCSKVPAVQELTAAKPSSRVEVLEVVESTEESITGAEKILSLGRGALEEDNLQLAQVFAEKVGAMIGGTRPLVDDGTIPFERQIGQTGSTVHPKICLYFGVSGAIQHTEGVRDAKLTIAVNKDPDAAIFDYADYGVAADMKEILSALLQLY